MGTVTSRNELLFIIDGGEPAFCVYTLGGGGTKVVRTNTIPVSMRLFPVVSPRDVLTIPVCPKNTYNPAHTA